MKTSIFDCWSAGSEAKAPCCLASITSACGPLKKSTFRKLDQQLEHGDVGQGAGHIEDFGFLVGVAELRAESVGVERDHIEGLGRRLQVLPLDVGRPWVWSVVERWQDVRGLGRERTQTHTLTHSPLYDSACGGQG